MTTTVRLQTDDEFSLALWTDWTMVQHCPHGGLGHGRQFRTLDLAMKLRDFLEEGDSEKWLHIQESCDSVC